MSAPENRGKLPPELLFKVKSGGRLEEADIEVFRACMDTDPRAAVLLLRRVEYMSDRNVIFTESAFLVRVLLENDQTRGAATFALRSTAYKSSGELGASTVDALERFDDPTESERAQRWTCFRLSRELVVRLYDSMGDLHFCDAADTTLRWISRRSWDDASWVPFLLVAAKNRGDNHLLLSLVARTEVDFDQYELGKLADPLSRLQALVECISEPSERVKRAALLGGYHDFFDELFAGPLSESDVDLLKNAASDPDGKLFVIAGSRLAKESGTSRSIAAWLRFQALDGRDEIHWTAILAAYSSDLGLARDAMSRLLVQPGFEDHHRVLLYLFLGLKNVCLPPSAIPADEGIALLWRVLEREDLDTYRWQIWSLLIEAYGSQLADMGSLMDELRSCGHGRWDIASALAAKGFHREEISGLLESRMLARDEDLLPLDRWRPPFEMLHAVGSTRDFEIAMKVAADKAFHYNARGQALGFLAWHHGDRGDFRSLLLRLALSDDFPTNSYARSVALWRFPDVPELRATVQAENYENFPLGLDGFLVRFDDEGFREWFEGSEGRRQRLIADIVGTRDDFYRNRCVDYLVFWFGDHPETFPFLAGLVRASAVPPDLSRLSEARRDAEGCWDREDEVRAHCMRTAGLRWPEDERVHDLAREAVEHPWRKVRLEAASLLCREYAGFPDTVERIAKHIAHDAIIFGEYTVLVKDDPEGMRFALRVLESLDAGPELKALAKDGPFYLVTSFGPRKDLKFALENISLRTANEDLKNSIAEVVGRFFS